MTQEKSVLLLGRKNRNVQLSCCWDFDLIPNIYEPDVIIVDLTTLSKEVLLKNIKKYQELAEKLFNKFLNNGFIVFITSHRYETNGYYILSQTASNYFLSPIEFGTSQTAIGKKMIYDGLPPFKNYLKSVDNYSFHLIFKGLSPVFKVLQGSNLRSKLILRQINNEKYAEPYRNAYDTLYQNYGIHAVPGSVVTDNGNNIISAGYQIEVADIQGSNELTGKAMYLPPSNLPPEEYINLILTDLGISEVQENFPEWIHQVKISGLDLVEKKLQNLKDERNKFNNSIDDYEQRKQKLQSFYNLIISHGSILENTVYAAFKKLGFNDINNKRGKGNEDWRFEFKTGTEIKYGLIEVHGTEGSVGLEKINQCKKWVDDYAISFGEEAKGIFIVNQFRLNKYPESIKKRNDFHPQHIKFAKERKICIVPSTSLFNWVNSKLSGKNVTRSRIEKLLLETDGLIAE